MTTSKTFIVRYPVTTYIDVEVERPSDISREELLTSISKDDLINGDTIDEGAWDSLKSAWREGYADWICDEDYEEVEFN